MNFYKRFFFVQACFSTLFAASIPTSIYYTESSVSDKITPQDESMLTILRLDAVKQGVFEEIISTNADIVCFFETSEYDFAPIFYEELKHTYTHFYQIVAPFPSQNNMIITSKYPIENMECYDDRSIEQDIPCISLDFIVKNGQNTIGCCSLLGIDNHGTENAFSFFCEGSTSEQKSLTKPILTSNSMPLGSLLTARKNSLKKIGIMRHNYVEYEVSVKETNEGTSARGEIDYVVENGDSRFSTGVEVSVEKDRNGETRSSIEATARGRF